MKARIVITYDGKISIFTDEGNLEGGKEAIRRLLSDLTANGIEFSQIGAVEQHRHAQNHEEVHHGEKAHSEG